MSILTRLYSINNSPIQHLTMASTTKSLTVFGGNGFLGKRICQRAVLNGYNVVSLSYVECSPPHSILFIPLFSLLTIYFPPKTLR